MIFLYLTLLVLGLSIFLCLFPPNGKNAKEPSGLRPFSILTLLRVFVHPHAAHICMELGKLHGPLMYFKIAHFKGILVNGPEAVREVCRNPALNGRVDCMYKDLLGQKGILWKDESSQNRKFFFKSSKHFGLGIKSAENNIHQEINLLFKYFDSFNAKPFSIKGTFNIPTLNGILHRFLGEKISHDDANLKSSLERLALFLELPGVWFRLCVFLPQFTRWLPGIITGRNWVENLIADFTQIFYPLVEKHFQTRIPHQPRDLADALMDEVEATQDINSDFHISRDPIRPILFDMFTAAVETTGALLDWTVLYLAKSPQVQMKLQTELFNVIGQEKLPELTDRPKMPYFQAFLQEMYRVAPVVPFWYHMALEDTTLRGYSISKGTVIVGNFYGIHMDPDLWDEPEEFQPERFIDENGEFVKSDQIFVFGSGKRSCIGEVTARDQLFLFLTRILQTYTIKFISYTSSSMGKVAVGYHAPEFKVIFMRRDHSKINAE